MLNKIKTHVNENRKKYAVVAGVATVVAVVSAVFVLANKDDRYPYGSAYNGGSTKALVDQVGLDKAEEILEKLQNA